MVTDAQRLDLYHGLVEMLGPKRADVLMQMVPGAGWSDVARRSDIDLLRSEIGSLRAEFEGKFGQIEGKFGQIDGKFGQIDGKFGQIDGKLGRLEGRMYAAMAAQTIATVGLVVALVKL